MNVTLFKKQQMTSCALNIYGSEIKHLGLLLRKRMLAQKIQTFNRLNELKASVGNVEFCITPTNVIFTIVRQILEI